MFPHARFKLVILITAVVIKALDQAEWTLYNELSLGPDTPCGTTKTGQLVCYNPFDNNLFEYSIVSPEGEVTVFADSITKLNQIPTMNITDLFYKFMLLDDKIADEGEIKTALARSSASERSMIKRGWSNCQYSGPRGMIKAAACHTAHAFYKFVRNAGSATAGGILSQLINSSIDSNRSNRAPRSNCVEWNSAKVCVSWNEYTRGGESWDVRQYMSNFALQCAENGMSSKIRTRLDNGQDLWVCFSDRENNCDGGGVNC